jgi:hypothetical protein
VIVIHEAVYCSSACENEADDPPPQMLAQAPRKPEEDFAVKLVGHMNVCPWPSCRRLIRSGQHLTREDAYACDMYVTLTLKSGERTLIVNQKDFAAWALPLSGRGAG